MPASLPRASSLSRPTRICAGLAALMFVGALTLGTSLITTASPASAQAASPTRQVPAIVTVGFLINDVQEIDLQRNSYAVDFYIWFRWTDPAIDPAKTFELMNSANQDGAWRIPATDAPVRLPDGSLYFREHMLMRFEMNMTLEDYPYDQQDLSIIIEDVNLTSDEMIYVLDDPAVQTASDLSIPGYQVGTPTATVTDFEYPEMGAIGTGITSASRIVVTIPIDRPWLPLSLKIFVPFILVVLCASLVFLIDPRFVDVRIGLGITSLLTLIALKWMTDGEMPLMDYLGLVDTLYLLAFVFVTLGLAETVYTTWRHTRGDDDVVLLRTGRRILLVAGPVFLIACVLVLIPHLR